MFRKALSLVILTIALFSCKKETTFLPVQPPDPATPVALLKDIIVNRLPSPYYHFEYDSTRKVSFLSFASDLNRYNVIYSGNRIIELRNNIIVNKDRLQYSYDNSGRASNINYSDSMGVVYTRLNLFYDGNRLTKIERRRKTTAGFVMDKIMTMSYYSDGNLLDLTYHYLAFNGQPEAVFTDRFERYDDKINVEGFSLVHNEFFDHLVLLPGVQLQKNNPGKESRTGDAQNYTVDYNYTYNIENMPLTKKGNLILFTGTGAGQQFETSSVYTYYQ